MLADVKMRNLPLAGTLTKVSNFTMRYRSVSSIGTYIIFKTFDESIILCIIPAKCRVWGCG